MEYYLSKERAESCLEHFHTFFLCVLHPNSVRYLVITQKVEVARDWMDVVHGPTGSPRLSLKSPLVLVNFVNLTQTRALWDESLLEYLPRSGWSVGVLLADRLAINRCWRPQATLDDTIPRRVVLGSQKSMSLCEISRSIFHGSWCEWTLQSELMLCRIANCTLLLGVLSPTSRGDGLWPGSIRWNKPFASQVAFGQCLIPAI